MTLSQLLCPSCALFLDFDGTLVDIAMRPDAVQVPPGLVDVLQGLHHALGGALAVISGRPIAQIDAYLAPLRLGTAGVHGAERRRADGSLVQEPVASLAEALRAATRLASRHPGLRVEVKRGALALHYRLAPALEGECVQALQQAAGASPGLALLRGKMVVEVKPAGVSKGRAIQAFLREAPFAGRRPVFIGDDQTDEAGFAAVQACGGAGVKVGGGPSSALHRCEDAAQMRAQLAQALALGSGGMPARRCEQREPS